METAVRRLIKGISTLVHAGVLVFLFLIMGYGVYSLWDTYVLTQSAVAEQYQQYSPKKSKLSYEDLTKLNPDVCGWLTIYGTEIDYPLVKGENDWKYINTSATGDYSLTGALFLNSYNRRDFSDFNTIIYGHNMTPKVMFGGIKDFQDKDYFESRKYGDLYDGEKHYGLEIFQFMHADAYDTKVYQPGVKKNEAIAYMKFLKGQALINRECQITTEDRILLLSTCSNTDTNGRHILLAKITNQQYEDEYSKNEAEKKVPGVVSAGKILQKIGSNRVLLILFLVILEILFYTLYRWNQKRREYRS